jgi:glutamate-ammonia-ligase adenylyltransferase
LTSPLASRFYQHWLNADPARAGKVTDLASKLGENPSGLSLSPAVFDQILQNETSVGLPLPRAMRRLRNLIIATLITRDLDGRADLAEVLSTMSAFADFAIRTHLQAATAEITAAHGEPIGAESGRVQEMIVLGMGKLGGGELNVSSDIDLIFVYPEDGETRAVSPGHRL